MDATKGNIYQILNGSKQFVIPVYQRTYSWEKEQCMRLWRDIAAMQKSNREGHFVGSIVNIEEKAMPIGVQKYMIIDGQQRLTTLTLLLIALRDYASVHSEEAGINAHKITDTLLLNAYESGSDRYKLFLTQTDREVLIKLIEHSPMGDEVISRLIDNYLFFAGQIAKMELSPVEVYQSIGKLQIVNITLDRQSDDPQAIFESLNSTGIDLSESDLIRNHILMGLDTDKQTAVYNNTWRPTELLFNYERASSLMDKFFRDYLTMKLGRIPNKNKVYEEFKAYHANCGLEVSDLCLDIYSFSKHYTDMYFCRSGDERLKSLYEEMRSVQMEVAYPFLMKVHDDCDSGVITLDELLEIIRLCVSYVLRRSICDIPTNSLNKTFATMKNHIRADDYLNSVKAFFIMQDSYKEFPNDERFISAFLSRDIYHMRICNYILSRLENYNNKSAVKTDALTIEHIIPQNPKLSMEWVANLGENWREVQKKYLHTIGNLTLTAYNSEMSDSSFTDKLDMEGGFKQSALRLNRYVVMQTTWGEDQVKTRGSELGKLAKNIWPFPALNDEQLAPYIKQDDIVPQYSIDSYEQLNAFNRILFEKLNTCIMNLSAFVKREFKKLYIAYKVDTNFVDVVIQKSRLRLSVNMKFADVIDPKGLCKDITGLGRWGNGDVELFLDSLEQLDDVMFIVEQGFQEQMGIEVKN
jgi:uncharacterized protein with ParB-like and HNH nuclease domain/predicted transport protein